MRKYSFYFPKKVLNYHQIPNMYYITNLCAVKILQIWTPKIVQEVERDWCIMRSSV